MAAISSSLALRPLWKAPDLAFRNVTGAVALYHASRAWSVGGRVLCRIYEYPSLAALITSGSTRASGKEESIF